MIRFVTVSRSPFHSLFLLSTVLFLLLFERVRVNVLWSVGHVTVIRTACETLDSFNVRTNVL
jgi:hypothetical protein